MITKPHFILKNQKFWDPMNWRFRYNIQDSRPEFYTSLVPQNWNSKYWKRWKGNELESPRQKLNDSTSFFLTLSSKRARRCKPNRHFLISREKWLLKRIRIQWDLVKGSVHIKQLDWLSGWQNAYNPCSVPMLLCNISFIISVSTLLY